MKKETDTRPVPDAQAVRDAMETLRGKSRSELLETLRGATDEARAAGELDNTRMDDIYEKLAPYLSEAQRERMREVIARLKD